MEIPPKDVILEDDDGYILGSEPSLEEGNMVLDSRNQENNSIMAFKRGCMVKLCHKSLKKGTFIR